MSITTELERELAEELEGFTARADAHRRQSNALGERSFDAHRVARARRLLKRVER